MSIDIRAGGQMRRICQAFVRVAGTWREIQGVYRRINDAFGTRIVFEPLYVGGGFNGDLYECTGDDCPMDRSLSAPDRAEVRGGSSNPKVREWTYLSGSTAIEYIPGPTPEQSFFRATVERDEQVTATWRLTVRDGPVVETFDCVYQFTYAWTPP